MLLYTLYSIQKFDAWYLSFTKNIDGRILSKSLMQVYWGKFHKIYHMLSFSIIDKMEQVVDYCLYKKR